MNPDTLRKKFIEFFIQKGHKEMPPASLVPQDDPTTLFNGSGMQPMIPYFKGNPHPMGKRLVDSQPCFRAEDIREVGDNRHTTFFEMLGNWSLGDYFKREQLFWVFEFLTEIVKLDPKKLYVTVFEGNGAIPKDTKSIAIWQKLFKTKETARKGEKGFEQKIKIYTYGSENWWSRAGIQEKMPVGEIGGPDSEIFYDFGKELKLHENSSFKDLPCHVNCECGRFLEIGNSVFMEYKKQKNGSFKPLPNKNVDFGGGLERIAAASINSPDIFKIDLLWPIIQEIEKFCDKKYKGNEGLMRVIADHLKAATFMISAGVEPGNKRQGYILRRLIRRSAVKMHQLKGGLTPDPAFVSICNQVIRLYDGMYFDSKKDRPLVSRAIDQEMDKFSKTLDKGLKLIEKKSPFDLFQTYGFPFEITQELLAQKGQKIDKKEFDKEFEKHQKLSRTASKGMFKGGLADHSEEITKLHTATHLLHEALRRVLGNDVQQVGSHITDERLRFDFTHPKKLTENEIKEIEDMANEQVSKNLPIKFEIMSLEEAQKQSALAFFGQKYPEKVKVYSIGTFSKEVCGGPHVDFTGKLSVFKIIKEEAVGSSKRRLYARVGK